MPVNSSSFAALTTPEGLRSLRSASSLSFLVTCQRQVIPSHSFAALTALIVRRVKGSSALAVRRVSGYENRPSPACASRRTPPGGALACASGSGTLPPAHPPEGHWRAHPAAAPCRPHTPQRGIGVRTRQRHLAARTPHGGRRACIPGSGALPAHVNGGFTFLVHRELRGTTCRESAPPSVSVSRHGRRFRSAARR